MPRMDGSGPLGQGSRTGRGLGQCGSTNVDDVNRPEARPGISLFGRLAGGFGFARTGVRRGAGHRRGRRGNR